MRAGDIGQLLGGILAPDEVALDPEVCRLHSGDVYSQGETAIAVVSPRSVERLAAAVGALTRAGVAVAPRGGGMSYTGGYTPARPGTAIIDLSRLDRIVEIAAEDMFVTVEAGVTWKQLHRALRPLGLRTPFFGTFSGARATVGGGLSNGALFLGTARHGTAADSLLGLEVVLADGTILRTGQCALAAAERPFYRTCGPDLSGLFTHDAGTLGIKARATLRLMRAPAHEGYASFVFGDMPSAARALSEVARTGAAEEAYVFDPETTRRNLRSEGVVDDAGKLLKVIAQESGLLRGLRAGARLVAAGRDFLPPEACSLHVVAAGRSAAAVEADLDACRQACAAEGGREIVDSIPRAVRADLFPEPDGVLGADGDRWAALNAKVAHSQAASLMAASAALLAPYEERMRRHRVWMSHLLIAIDTHAFSFEPVFHWHDEWLPLHEHLPSAATLARFKRPKPNPEGTALVHEMRAQLVALFARHGAASNQLGKTYPYLSVLRPEPAALLRAVKTAVDPAGLVNPGALGFP
jgi:FAD/FMN-containing dehydrogenase